MYLDFSGTKVPVEVESESSFSSKHTGSSLRRSVSIILLFAVAFSGCFAACAFAQPASVQAPPPVVWQGIDVSTTLQIGANGAVVLGVPATIFLALLALRQIKESRAARHAELTLRLFEYYQCDHMREVMDYIRRPELKSPDGNLDFEKVRADGTAEKYFYDLANFFEIVAVLVESKQWDPGMAATLFGQMLSHHWTVCAPVVIGYRDHQKYPDLWKPWQTYVENM